MRRVMILAMQKDVEAAMPNKRIAQRIPVFFSSRRRRTIFDCDWSSDVCSSDLESRAEHEGLDARERVLQRVEDLQQEAAVEVHGAGHITHDDELRSSTLALAARKPNGVAAGGQGEPHDATRVEARTAPSDPPAAAGSRAEAPDDASGRILEVTDVLVVVVLEVLRAGGVSRAGRRQRYGLVVWRVGRRRRPPVQICRRGADFRRVPRGDDGWVARRWLGFGRARVAVV